MEQKGENSAVLGAEFLRHVLDIAEKRSHILSEMKKALLSQEYEKVMELAKLLTGVDPNGDSWKKRM